MRARVFLFAFVLLAKPAAADPTDPAAARELFDEARALMSKGEFGEAEKRLTAALAYSNGRGIKYQLAVCHEKLGHVARAWKLYAEVAESARQAGEGDRERVARARAADLSARVPHVHVIGDADVSATIDGERVTTDAPIAIDPGHHAVHAEQAGRRPWDAPIDVHESETLDVRVPELDPIVVETISSPPAIVSPPPRLPAPVSPRPTRVSPVRAVGIVVSSTGVAALAVGAGFVVASAATYASSAGACDAQDHCSTKGASIRMDALTYGDVATSLIIGGAVALAAGIVTWVAAPKGARVLVRPLGLEPLIRF
ncbi:MAG TPA: hypothetical protein VH054_01065 [Polyangiaceae bacterium]|jgi:hypothetical protein|nr:hypothetical protein [Polyangiaceae bacterium]